MKTKKESSTVDSKFVMSIERWRYIYIHSIFKRNKTQTKICLTLVKILRARILDH